MDSSVEVKAVKGAELIPYFGWCGDIPKRKQVDSEPTASIIVNVLQGRYHGLLGLFNNEPVAMLIYHMISEAHIDFKLMAARSYMAEFYMALMNYLNHYGVKSFGFESIHEPKLWQRIYPDRIKKIRSAYSFDLAGIYQDNEVQDAM